MKYIYGAFSDIGNYRPNNEDTFYAGKCGTTIPIYVGMVCDGIGGLKNGEVASEAIASHIAEWAAELDSEATFEQVTKSFLNYIYLLNEQICHHCQVNSIETGSTMSAILINEENFMLPMLVTVGFIIFQTRFRR